MSSRHCASLHTLMMTDAMLDRMVNRLPAWYLVIANSITVRTSAKELTALIMDEERLRTERNDRKTWKSRVTGIEEYGPSGSGAGGQGQGQGSHGRSRRHQRQEDEDLEYKLALEASKNEAEEDAKRRQSRDVHNADDDDLEKAIRLSKEEEELRRRELE